MPCSCRFERAVSVGLCPAGRQLTGYHDRQGSCSPPGWPRSEATIWRSCAAARRGSDRGKPGGGPQRRIPVRGSRPVGSPSLRSLTLPARAPRLEFGGIAWRSLTESGAQRTGSGAPVTDSVRCVVRFVRISGPNSCPPLEWGGESPGCGPVSRRAHATARPPETCGRQNVGRSGDRPTTRAEAGSFGHAALGGEWLLWYNRGWIGEFFGNLVESNVPGEVGLRPRTSNGRMNDAAVNPAPACRRKFTGSPGTSPRFRRKCSASPSLWEGRTHSVRGGPSTARSRATALARNSALPSLRSTLPKGG
jgi:hypothetical protein